MINTIIFLLIGAFIAFPYWKVYELSSAIAANDTATLTQLVDMESVQKVYKTVMEKRYQQAMQVLESRTGNVLTGQMTSDLARIFNTPLVNSVGSAVKDEMLRVDLAWVQQKLQPETSKPLFWNMSHAFFESPTTFTIRLGDLGESPLFARMSMQGWSWKVTAVYPP